MADSDSIPQAPSTPTLPQPPSLGNYGDTGPNLNTASGLLQEANEQGGQIAAQANELAHPATGFLATIDNGFKSAFPDFMKTLSAPSAAIASGISQFGSKPVGVGKAISSGFDPATALFGQATGTGTMVKTGEFLTRTATDVLFDPLTYFGDPIGGFMGHTTVPLLGDAAKSLDLAENTRIGLTKPGQQIYTALKTGENVYRDTVLQAGHEQATGNAMAAIYNGIGRDNPIVKQAGDILIDMLHNSLDLPIESHAGRDFTNRAIAKMMADHPQLLKTIADRGGIKFLGNTIIEGARIRSAIKLIPGMTTIDHVTAPVRGLVGSLFNPLIKKSVIPGAGYIRLPQEAVEAMNTWRDWTKAGMAQKYGNLFTFVKAFNLNAEDLTTLRQSVENGVMPAGNERMAKAYLTLMNVPEDQMKTMTLEGKTTSRMDMRNLTHVSEQHQVPRANINFKGAAPKNGFAEHAAYAKYVKQGTNPLSKMPSEISGADRNSEDLADFITGKRQDIEKLQSQSSQLQGRIEKGAERQPYVSQEDRGSINRGSEEILNRLRAETGFGLSADRKLNTGDIWTPSLADKSATAIPREQVDSISRFIDEIGPRMFDDVGMSIFKNGGKQGQYDFGKSLVSIFKKNILNGGGGSFDRTTIHELWHSLSRYLPQESVNNVHGQYLKDVANYTKSNPWFKEVFDPKDESVVRDVSEAHHDEIVKNFPEASKYFQPEFGNGLTPRYKVLFDNNTYRLKHMDEWFAENLTDKTFEHFDRQDQGTRSIIAYGKNILRSMVNGVKRAFGGDTAGNIFDQFVNQKNGEMVRGGGLRGSMESNLLDKGAQETEEETPQMLKGLESISGGKALINQIRSAGSTQEALNVIGRHLDSTMNAMTTGDNPSTFTAAYNSPEIKQITDARDAMQTLTPSQAFVGKADEYGLKATDETGNVLQDKDGNFYHRVGATLDELDKYGFSGFDHNILTAELSRWYQIMHSVGLSHFYSDMATQFGKKMSEAPDGWVAPVGKGLKEGVEKAFGSAFQQDGEQIVFHPDIAKNIEDFTGSIINDEPTQELMKYFDKIQGAWKASVTSVFPAFHGRNAITHALNNFLDLGVHAFNPSTHIMAGQFVKMDMTIGGLDEKITGGVGQDAIDATNQKAEMLNRVMFKDNTGHDWTFGQLRQIFKDRGVAFGTFGGGGPEDINLSNEELKQKLSGVSSDKNLFTKIPPKLNPFGQNFLPYEQGRNVGYALANQARMVNLISNLKNTGDVELAVARTKQFLFDYGNLTPFEKTFMRRMIPFYTFTRKNLELQVKSLLTSPGRVKTELSSVQNLADVMTGNHQLTDQEKASLPDWIRNSTYSVTAKNGENVTVQKAFQTPAEQWLQALQPNQILGSVSPILRVPVEQATGYSFFQGKPLSQVTNATAYQNAPQILKNFIGFYKAKGVDSEGKAITYYVSLKPSNMNLINNLPPTSRVISSLKQMDSIQDMPASNRILEQLVGMDSYNFNLTTEATRQQNQLKAQLQDLLQKTHVTANYTSSYIPKDQAQADNSPSGSSTPSIATIGKAADAATDFLPIGASS